MLKVLQFVHENYPHITPIMWDDMLRSIDVDILKGCNLRPPFLHFHSPDTVLQIYFYFFVLFRISNREVRRANDLGVSSSRIFFFTTWLVYHWCKLLS